MSKSQGRGAAPGPVIQVIESYVGSGAPPLPASATSVNPVGYGLTKEQAFANADHFPSRVKFVKFRSHEIRDQWGSPAFMSREEEVAWSVVGWQRQDRPTALQDYCAQLIRRGKFASAILTYLRG